MIKGCKICGIKDPDTLNFIINHPHPPKFIGFICNYPKSSRYVEPNSLNKLLNVKKNKSEFVAVLVKPNNEILEEIKNLPFDYYQMYDCAPVTIKNIKLNKELMLAGNIKFNDNLKNYKKIANYLDLSGGLETSGLKDTSKINIFLNNLNKLINET